MGSGGRVEAVGSASIGTRTGEPFRLQPARVASGAPWLVKKTMSRSFFCGTGREERAQGLLEVLECRLSLARSV